MENQAVFFSAAHLDPGSGYMDISLGMLVVHRWPAPGSGVGQHGRSYSRTGRG